MKHIKTIVFVVILTLMGFIIFKSAQNQNSANNNGEYALLEQSLVKNLLIGNWRSTQDEKFSREFFIDGRVVDNYVGYENAPIEGIWRYVDDTSKIDIDISRIDPDMPIVEILYMDEYYYFGVIASVEAPDSLSLVYLEGNEILNFSRTLK